MPQTSKTRAKLTGVAPMFLVDDVAKSAEWYRDVLGFEVGEYFREHHHPHGAEDEDHDHSDVTLGEAVFVILHRDGQRLMLGKTVERGHGVMSNVDFKQYSSDAYFWTDDVSGLFAQVKDTGAKFLQELETQFYGLQEFRIKDYDGRVLTFGGPVG